MAVIKVYSRINWLNKSESLTTPLGKTNLNKMDKAINLIDDEVVSMSAKIDEIDTTKVSADQLNNMVTDVSFNDKNGVISITKHNGTVLNFDTAMEKIAVNFEYDAQAQQLILTLENGEKQYIDMSAIITQYEFEDTDTIAFNVDSDGKVSVSVKNGSITKAMLSSEILSTITIAETNAVASAEAAAQSATNAELDAKMAQSYSVGKSGIRDGEDTDNAKYYCDLAEKHKDSAAMSESNAGISETNAKASESNAATSESNAKISETIAEEKASEAGTSAETATSKANEVAISASVASESEKNAKKSEKLSRSYAIGDADGTRENEDTDNSKYYAAQAEKYAKQAEDIAGGNFIPNSEKGVANGVAVLNANLAVEKAVADEDGNNIKDTYATKHQVPDLVKVDNETITKDENGILHGAMSVDVDSELSETSENPVQNKVVTSNLTDLRKGAVANLLKPTLSTTTQNGVTCTNNGDGTYTLNGTATSEVVFAFLPIEQGKSLYKNIVGKTLKFLNGGAINRPVGRFLFNLFTLRDGDNWWAKGEQYDNSIFTVSEGYSQVVIDLRIYKNQTVTDLIVKPMLTTNLSATYDDFVPYTGDTGRLNGDVAELQDSKADKTEVPKLVKVDNKTVFLSEDGVLSAKGGGGSSFAPKDVTNASITNGNGKVSITWTDPDDVTLEGITLSTWAGTKLVMNESNYPTNENDGTVVLNSTTRNQYQSTGYTVTGLTNNKTYYFALFPYSTDGIYNYSETGRLLGKPSLVKLDPCTDMKATATMGKVTVTWTDPNATKTENGNTATWQKTVLVYKQGTTAPTDINDGTIAVEEMTRNQYQNTGYEATSLIDGNDYSFSLFAISTDSAVSDATSVSAKLYATLTVTTEEVSLYGKVVTVTSGSQKVTGTFNDSGSVTLRIPWLGNTTISATDGTDTTTATVNIAEYGNSYNAELSFLKIVTFADGTDEEIAAMIQAHYDNKINISDYWAVGDKRSVNLSAMSATYVGESHRAQTVQFAIADFEKDELSAAINGHAKAAITLTQVDCLMDATSANNSNNGSNDTEKGYMNSTNTNVGGWKGCARRTWCNNVYFGALPTAWQSMIKTVNKKVSVGNNSSTIETVQDKIFLAAEIEIFGSTTYSFAGEGTQYQYYKNATANRYKMPKWTSSYVSHIYWERSPYGGDTNSFCRVNPNGSANGYNADFSCGVAPCLCI